MEHRTWSRVDAYLDERLGGSDADAMTSVLAAHEAAGLPAINVSPNQGRLLEIVASGMGARRILEIGTLGGYSTIWLARAAGPDGRVVTLEADPHHAEVARATLDRAGFGTSVEIRLGPAAKTLTALSLEEAPPFDFVFIDADKVSYPNYLRWAVRLARPGALIVADNVVRDGAVIDADSPDPSVRGVRRFLDLLGGMRGVRATALQTVGSKGYDGLAFALVDPAAPGYRIRVERANTRASEGLIRELDADLHRRYPGEPTNGIDAEFFETDGGFFVVAYMGERAVACGAFRPYRGDAELKRMYVRDEARGQGIARAILAYLEDVAVGRGYARMILETGTGQHEAIGLYESAGYTPIPAFGSYVSSPISRCFQKML